MYHTGSLLLDKRHAPNAPALSPNLDILISVSWLTRLSEYLRIALLTGRLIYSPASESVPPSMTSSGLKIFISPAIPFPKFTPIFSRMSMQSTSSFRTASSRSPSEISSAVQFPGEYGVAAFPVTFYQDTVESRSGSLCFETAFLAAMA